MDAVRAQFGEYLIPEKETYMAERDCEREVIEYLMKHHPVRKVWHKPELLQITKNWTIQNDWKPLPGGIDSMLQGIFTHFNIDPTDYDPENYFQCEYPFWQNPPPAREKKPLSVSMIIESAKAKRWLYD